MKKIISILMLLGLVLGLFVTAAPVAAQVECPADCTPITIDDVISVGPPDFCAGSLSNYLLGDPALVTDITLPASLAAGADSLFVDFPAGTDLSGVDATDVIVNSWFMGGPFSPAAITVTGTRLEFLVPAALMMLPATDVITIQVNGVINTPTAGDYCLFVGYMLDCCDHKVFDCVEYTVAPAICELDFQFDFSPTYPGLNPGFVPPFKACGQNMTTTSFCSTINGFLEPFDLNLIVTLAGCAAPCSPANMWFVVEECPENEVITFVWDSGSTSYSLTDADVGDKQTLPSVALPTPCTGPLLYTWSNEIHFSSPGDYEICFYLECPAVPCQAPGAQIVAEECLVAEVYQWKNWFQIDLNPKWNLISLPLFPFNTDIEYIMSSLNWSDQFMSVWYYDRCEGAEGTWYSYPGDLDTMEAGKAYWIRMKHPGDVGYNVSFNTGNPAGLFVWGTHAPMPPADPMQSFDVCEGWNMVGFKPPWVGTPLAPTWEWDGDYLWNFWNTFTSWPEYGTIYEWDSTVQDWIWYYPYNCQMQAGLGYWIPFERDGVIYPKA